MSSLLALPEEVIANIISTIPDTTLLAISQTCRKLNRICSSPLEMRERCLQFRFWDEKHDIKKKRTNPRPAEVNWKELFLHRYKVDQATSNILNNIIEYPTDHIIRFNKIADFGYDAKDCLARHAEISDDEVPDSLARRWHATAAIRYIHRRRALSIIRRVSTHDDVPLEIALASLELFNHDTATPDLDDTIREFDELAALFTISCPEFSTLSTEEKSLALVRWLWEKGFTGTPVDRYRALKNTFVGMTIRTVRTAIPLTLVAIFCGVARRMGLLAYACGYPGHVYAMVEDEENVGGYQYYDLYHNASSTENPRMDEAQLRSHLPPGDWGTVRSILSPAKPADMVIRMAQNILSTLNLPQSERLHNNHGYPHVCEHAILYAALTAMVVLEPARMTRNVVRHMTQQIPDDFPMDVRFLEEELLTKIDNGRDRDLMENVCNALRAEDSTPKPASRRDTPESDAVLHRVGTVFQHKRYNLNGVIFGWTPTCCPTDGEAWIQQMQVDNLSKGRKQPFYNSLVEDGSVRYVAEENIIPIKPKSAEYLNKFAGKYFKRFNKKEGRFESNVKHEFPDD